MMPRFAALSISEKPVLRVPLSALPESIAARVFFSADLRRDLPARLRTSAFAACRCCFSAERVFAIDSLLLFRFHTKLLEFLPRQRRFLRRRVLVYYVLQLHDALGLLVRGDVRVALLQQRAGDLVGLRILC